MQITTTKIGDQTVYVMILLEMARHIGNYTCIAVSNTAMVHVSGIVSSHYPFFVH